MKYPSTRFVFDRKKTATATKDALVQVEVLYERKKKYISTGVKVYKDQWSDKSHVINNEDAIRLNARISKVKGLIDGYIESLLDAGREFEWDAFQRFLITDREKSRTFIGFIKKRIEERTDIRESTKKSQRKILSSLEEFGRIVSFDDLTRRNIALYYEWLLGRDIVTISRDGTETVKKMELSTAWTYMKTLRTYIHDAIILEIIDRDPSAGIKVKREKQKNLKWLTEDEIRIIENATLSSGSLVRVRDLFIFMCYSGLAFSDMMDFTPQKLQEENGQTFLIGNRVKTGEQYIVLILPQAKALLEKYSYKMPKYTNQQFNKRLKDVMTEIGIDKPVSSHFARHTFAMMALNNGVGIETVAKTLGHSSIKITESIYAEVLKKTVAKEMVKMVKE